MALAERKEGEKGCFVCFIFTILLICHICLLESNISSNTMRAFNNSHFLWCILCLCFIQNNVFSASRCISAYLITYTANYCFHKRQFLHLPAVESCFALASMQPLSLLLLGRYDPALLFKYAMNFHSEGNA